MNIGLIAHDSKKKLMQNFCIAYEEYYVKMNYMQQERQEDLWRRLPI